MHVIQRIMFIKPNQMPWNELSLGMFRLKFFCTLVIASSGILWQWCSAIQYNTIFFYCSRRETADIHNDMYDSITDNCHAGQYCGKYCDYSDYR